MSDYEAVVAEEPLLLEAFGACLPTGTAGQNFRASVLDPSLEV